MQTDDLGHTVSALGYAIVAIPTRVPYNVFRGSNDTIKFRSESMKLMRARVTNFKSVLDSEWFTLDQLTCLVGKNESGKTAILESLEKLKSVRAERQPLKETEYPRMNWSEYEESNTADVAIAAEWKLGDDEISEIKKILGDASLLESTTVEVSKTYDNNLQWTSPFNVIKVARWGVEHSNLNVDEKQEIAEVGSTTDLLKYLKDLDEPSLRQTELLAELNARWPQGGAYASVNAYLNERLPNFVYYSQYDRLPGRVSLDQLLAAQQSGNLESIPGARVFMALLSMVGTTPTAINEISTSEELISKLEAVQNRLSHKVFTYWSQNKHLKVRFRFDHASPGDQPPFNTGKVFQTRIENTRHEATIGLDERSSGFIWFFSFLVWFAEVQKEFGDRLIVLLDEPGLTLHARAQADLLRYFREELLPKYQLIYTTHSPFMIDPANLLSCRTVEDATGPEDEVLGTKVGDQVLSVDSDTLFPLQAALGYDLTQTLFMGEHTLLVEGPSDLLYLQWASDKLRKAGRTNLDLRWTITPCGGLTKVPSFLSLFGGNRLHVAVLTDYGQGDKAKVREIRESDLLRAGHVFSADAYAEEQNVTEADTEDILGRELYRTILAKAYGLKSTQTLPKKRPDDASPRLTQEAKTHFQTLPPAIDNYDHYRPSLYLIENPNELNESVTSGPLDRFERLFVDLNALL